MEIFARKKQVAEKKFMATVRKGAMTKEVENNMEKKEKSTASIVMKKKEAKEITENTGTKTIGAKKIFLKSEAGKENPGRNANSVMEKGLILEKSIGKKERIILKKHLTVAEQMLREQAVFLSLQVTGLPA